MASPFTALLQLNFEISVQERPPKVYTRLQKINSMLLRLSLLFLVKMVIISHAALFLKIISVVYNEQRV